MKTNNKGFTLIELLVVIAIIGVLSGMIVVSMSGAQASSKDARIISEMDQLRTEAELYKLVNSSYGSNVVAGDHCAEAGTFFAADSEGDRLCDDMLVQADGLLVHILTGTSGAYCIQKTLTNGTTKWCVDSSGYSGTTANCDGTNYNCP